MDMKGSTVPNSSLTRNILSSRDPEKPTMRHGLRVTLDRLDLWVGNGRVIRFGDSSYDSTLLKMLTTL